MKPASGHHRFKLIFLTFQALEVIEEVGTMIAVKYCKTAVPDFSEKDIELIEVGIT